MLQKMQQFRPHDEASNQHTSLAQRCTVPRAHPSTKERSLSPKSSGHTAGTEQWIGPQGKALRRSRRVVTTNLVNDVLRACKQLVQTPAHMHARFAHWCSLFAFCECALLSCTVLSCPALANFKWECITHHCSRTRCRRRKGRSVCLYGSICICVVYVATVGTTHKLEGACRFSQRVRILRSLLPTSSFRARVDGPSSQPTDMRNHTKCAVRALMPTLAVYPPHVCHRQRDWAVSIGSHMQQDMDISEAPPHRDAPIPMFEYRSLQKTIIPKIGDNFS